MTSICAAGAGGGSLVYQEPGESVFDTHFPERLDYAILDRVHYPRVAKMLQLAVAPDGLVNSPNYEPTAYSRAMQRVPAFRCRKFRCRSTGATRWQNGDGALGLNNGWKAFGSIRCTSVTDVERAEGGRWRVYVDCTDVTGRVLENKMLTTKALVMAAGSANTTRLVVRAGAQGRIPDLPDELGGGWGTNADRIYIWSDLAENFGRTQGGPVVDGIRNWDSPERVHGDPGFVPAGIVRRPQHGEAR